MRAWFWTLLLLFLPGRAFAAAETIFVEDQIGGLVERLREELPGVSLIAEGEADLRVRLSNELLFSIVDRRGAVLIERTLEGSRTAAVRAAALLVADAQKSWEPGKSAPAPEPQPALEPAPPLPAISVRPATPYTAPPPATSPPWRFGATAGFGAAWRWSNTRPQFLYALSLTAGRGDFEGAAVLSLTGPGCCAIESEAIESRATAFSALAQGRWSFYEEFEVVSLSLLLGLGYQWESVDARAIAGFAARGILEEASFAGPIARAGLAVAVPLVDPLSLRLDAGAQFQPIDEVGLPDFPEYQGVRGRLISTSPIAPYAVISLGITPF